MKKRGYLFLIAVLLIIPLVIAEDIKNTNSILESVKISEFLQKTIEVTNKENSNINFVVNVTGNITELVKLKQKQFEIEKDNTSIITIDIIGKGNVGKYEGKLIIIGDINKEIPIVIQVYDKNFMPIQALFLNSKILTENVYKGGIFKFKLDLNNLLSYMNYTVDIKYVLVKYDNLTSNQGTLNIVEDSDKYEISKSISVIRDIKVPEEMMDGEYKFEVTAKYLNFTAKTNTLFNVKVKFYKYMLFGKVPVWLALSIAGFLALSFLIYKFIKHQQDKKKRFHAKLDYKTIPQEGQRSLWMGRIAETNRNAYIDMDKLTIHAIVAGSTGGGKSICAQDIVEECLKKDVAVIVFDPTAQWSGMLRKLTDKKFLAIYPAFGMKPSDARAFNGNIRAILDGRQIINLNDYLKPGEIQIFTTNKLDPKDYDMFVANTIREVFHSNLHEARELKILVVYDEIHRILPKFGGNGEGFVQIERGCREFRKWGIGILLISQVLQDFVGQIKANINTQVQMKTRDEGDLEGIKRNFGEEYVHALIKAPVGSGMIQNSAWNMGTPYYITFRPIQHSVERLSDDELGEYNKYNDIVDDIEYQFKQLEDMGQDVFDLKLELKLAKDKIKSGSFNMVKIYLEGLVPRVEKIWKKLGKTPKKKELTLVDEKTLKDELEKAKTARAKYEAEAKAAEGNKPKEEKKEVKEEKMDPEMAAANWTAVGELKKQAMDGIGHKDWNRTAELIIEITGTKVDSSKAKEKDAVVEEIKAAQELAKNPPKKEDKKVQGQAPAAAPGTAPAGTPQQPAQPQK